MSSDNSSRSGLKVAKGSPRWSLRLSTSSKRKRSTTSDKESESRRKQNLKKIRERLSPLKNKQLAILPEDSAVHTMSSRVMVPKGPITSKLTEMNAEKRHQRNDKARRDTREAQIGSSVAYQNLATRDLSVRDLTKCNKNKGLSTVELKFFLLTLSQGGGQTH